MLHVTLCLAAIVLGARGDILCLKDGRILEGPPMQHAEDGVQVQYQNGTVFVSKDLILEAVLEGAGSFVPTTDEERERVAQGMVPFEGRWISQDRRDQLLARRVAERREAIEAEKEYRVWRNRRTEHTKHFDFEYTVPQHRYEHFRDLMEAYFTAFAKQWNIRPPPGLGNLKVCFYIDRDAFEQIGGVSGGVVGYFRYVEPMELNFFYDGNDLEFTEDVMFHETNHYLTKLIDVKFDYPHFPGESLAEYYGASNYDPRTRKVESGLLQEGRLVEIQTDIDAGEEMSLKTLVQTERMYEHYTWGWSLVHYLMHDRNLAKKFQKFVLGLARDRDVQRTQPSFGSQLRTVPQPEVYRQFCRHLGLKDDDDVAALEVAWRGHIDDLSQYVTPRGLELAAIKAASEGRTIRARRLFTEAIAAGCTNARAYHKYAELLSRNDQAAEAIAQWKRAIELDPLHPIYYAHLGRTLKKRGDAKEGTRFMRLALEMDADGEHRVEELLAGQDLSDDS